MNSERVIDLSGLWQLACTREGFAAISAKVPGENCTALIEAGLAPDPNLGFNENEFQWVRDHDWTWSRTFEVPAEFLDRKRIWLNIDSLDTVGTVRINGMIAAESNDMFLRLRRDVKDFLREGENRIEITITAVEKYIQAQSSKQSVHYVDAYYSYIKEMNLVRKIQCQSGWDWGLCMPVSGIYGEVSLNASDGVRLEHVYTEQHHEPGICRLAVCAELDCVEPGREKVIFEFDGEQKTVTADVSDGINFVRTEFEVKSPKLWYPAGYGEQNLYPLKVTTGGGSKEKSIGLREMETVYEPDDVGRSLCFRVNGIKIFAKGADWIPLDSRPQTYTRDRYERLISDSVRANMNMLRVWGGGLYEPEDFYELCDEKGILVWQDLMFSCSIYPVDEEFLALAEKEVEYQVKRLRDHSCIALWCGDNECLTVYGIVKGRPDDPRAFLQFDRFNQRLGRAVKAADPTRMFWPSSPCNGPADYTIEDKENMGDIHYWTVWHGGASFDAYYKVRPRFCSEFGFQAFPCQNTVDVFTGGIQRNVSSPLMEFHQRNNAGNSKIVEMFTRYFRLPSTFEDFIYLSQVQQAVAMKIGVEFWRFLKPYCMGTLYWQLNDNWPVASWSSIDYYGNWKQLHYHARRFYSPVLAGAVLRDGQAEIHAVSDLQTEVRGELALEVWSVCGERKSVRSFPVRLDGSAAQLIATIPLEELTRTPEEDFLILRLEAKAGDQAISFRNECFPSAYKKYQLPQAKITAETSRDPDGLVHLKLTTDRPAFYVFAELKGVRTVFSDNSITLLPGETRELTFRTDEALSQEEIREKLVIRDLRSSYAE